MINDPAKAAGGALSEYMSHSGVRDPRPLAAVVKDTIANLQDMVRLELRLAKAEIREETAKSLSAARVLGAGVGLALFAAGFILVSVCLLLSMVMPAWLASLVLGCLLGVVALVAISKGKAGLQAPKPEKTIENLKENVQWMKNQTR